MKDDDREAPPLDGGPDEGGGEIIGNCIAIPPGIYEVRYMYYVTGYFKSNAKVTVYFAVVAPEEYAGTPLERFYNVDFLKEPPKRYGNFSATARGDLNREISALLGPVKRLNRISPGRLRGKRITCEVVTVVTDRNRRPLPPDQQYSRIDRFLDILPEDDW